MRLFRGIDRIDKHVILRLLSKKGEFKSEGAEGREVSRVKFVL